MMVSRSFVVAAALVAVLSSATRVGNARTPSTASPPVLKWHRVGSERYVETSAAHPQGDLASEEGVIRCDPNSMVKIGIDSQQAHAPRRTFSLGRFCFYNKGEQMDERSTTGELGVADCSLGPCIRSPLNPVANSGHRVCVWPHRDRVAALPTTDGPDKGTIQFAQDDLNFEVRFGVRWTAPAIGVVRSLDSEEVSIAAVDWGLCRACREGRQHIRRFSFRSKKQQVA